MDERNDEQALSKALENVVNAPAKLIGDVVTDSASLLKDSGALKPGRGMITSVLAFSLGALCLLSVIAFHFPDYLTMPDLRRQYSVEFLRGLLFCSLVLAGGLSLANIVLGRRRTLNIAALCMVLTAVGLGGSRVPVGDFPDRTFYLGIDWFILDLLGSTLVFVLIEKLFPLKREQPVFRHAWQTDLAHFGANHFLVGLVLLVVNLAIHRMFGWMVNDDLQQAVQGIPFLLQLLLCMLIADLTQYWTHRAFHEIPVLWRFHAIHHSVKTMDWLAGSRMHMLDMVATRVAVLGALYVLGFDKSVMDAYIIVVGFQSVFNHANVRLPWGPLKYLIVTPNFHHWHHASEKIALDRNYSAHFAFLDYLFGTAVRTRRHFPETYGVVGDYVPDGFIRQQAFPFKPQPPR